MGDAETRRTARRARATGEDELGRAARAEARVGIGLAAHLRSLVGTWVYLEGARMNYRGRLVEVFVSPTGSVEALLLEPAWRLGWWEEKPREHYHFRLRGAHAVPYEAIQAVGPVDVRQGGDRDSA